MNLGETSKTAVEELFKLDTPEGYQETLSIFFEAYIISSQCDGTNGDERSLALNRYKSLRRFLYQINQVSHNSDKIDSVWIS